MFDDSLDVVDFYPSNNIAVIYITEAELIAGCAYRNRLIRLRKVIGFCFVGFLIAFMLDDRTISMIVIIAL